MTFIRSQAAIFEKDGNYGVISLFLRSDESFVGSFDPRCNPSVYRESFAKPADAEAKYHENVCVTHDRGWKVLYNGARNFG